MHYLYGVKQGRKRLAATFDSEQQLLAYVRWATLQKLPNDKSKYEQGSVLVGSDQHEHSTTPLTADDPAEAVHNPSPSML